MDSTTSARHRTIQTLLELHAESPSDDAMALWNKMATQITSIVGEGAFASIYSRSVFLAQAQYPWLPDRSQPPQLEQWFADLKTSFSGQPSAVARDANRLILVTFTDILASLIGEDMTSGILRSAWGSDTSGKVGKELKDE